MDSMDLKGIAWVGHIYQKFEAMCLEVEEAMSQETAKYVENQVQTVGAGMKRFCSDVMQDLLPPSSKDLSRVASADLSLNPYLEFGIHKKPISNIKDGIKINPVCAENKSNSVNDVWEDWSFDWEISDKDEEKCDQMTMRPSNVTHGTTAFTKSSAKIVKRSRLRSSSNVLRAEYTDTCESESKVDLQTTSYTSNSQSINGDVSHTDSCEDSSRHLSPSQVGSNDGADTRCGQSVGDDEVFTPHTESSADCGPDLREETKNDATVQTMEPVGRELESEFEETCVLVDGNDYQPDNQKEEIKRSYKKKIQNVFSLKKKPTRKQVYEQISAQHNTSNTETPDTAIPPARSLSKNTKAATPGALESEWELL